MDVPRLPSQPGNTSQPAANHIDASTAPTTPPSIEERTPLRVGAWNVRRLGADDHKDTALLARLIEHHFDVLALEEVMQTEGAGHAGLDRLLAALGPSWTAQITASPRPNLRSPFSEFYAVLLRAGSVIPCPDSPHLAFHPDGDGSDAGVPDLFLREPAFGCYRETSAAGAASPLDFLLGVFHARWGTGSPAEIASEVQHLDEVLERQAKLYPAEKDILLIGDFNLGSSELAPLVNAEDATEGSGSTLNHAGERSDNLLDHLLVLNPEYTLELLAPAHVLDLRSEAGGGAAYVEHVSDHLPICALFRVPGPDDD